MPQRLPRRQILKLLALAAGGAAITSTWLNAVIKTLAQSEDGDYYVYLPMVAANAEPTSTSTPTSTPTPTSTSTPTSTPTPSSTPPPSPGIFVDGPGGDVDTGQDVLMSSNWSTRNGGQHASFQLEGLPGTIQHALLKFDLSSLSNSYTCVSAKLYLYHDYAPEGAGMNTGKVYCISAANWPWIEGIGDIDIARQGEPCWNAREADGHEGVQRPWAGSAGCSTSGVDYEPDAIGAWSFNANQPKGYEIVIDLNADRVQEWFGSSNTNYGIILLADDDIRSAHVGSAESATAGYRPKLVVHYE